MNTSSNAGKKKAVLISGCDTGFGKTLVEKLSKRNDFVVLAGCFTKEGIEQYRGNDNVVAIPLDVTSDKSVAEAKQMVDDALGKKKAYLFGLVNNAGILTRPGPTEWQDVNNYERMMAVNLYGVVRLTNAFLPLIRRSQGRIVIVASIAGRVGLSNNSAYCASKYAVSGYAEVLRRDVIPWKVAVSVVEPGIFGQTGLYKNWQTGLDETWKTLDAGLREDYGEKYYQYQRGLLGYAKKTLSNPDPDIVPEAILEALTCDKPQRRYRVGRDSNTLFRLLPLLPDHVVDFLLTRNPGWLPAAVQQQATGSEIYANDATGSIVAGALLGLSVVGTATVVRGLLSRL